MYTKRVQIINYGPISHLDIELPFAGENPKPVVLVGENGSGKSIFLSHIVNGLVSAKDLAYPETPEVDIGKVFKLRHPDYIRVGSDWCFGNVEFDDGLFTRELTCRRIKRDYSQIPDDLVGQKAQSQWNAMRTTDHSRLESSFHAGNQSNVIDDLFRNCALYFPHDRFEEPAWLNEENLRARAEHMHLPHLQGYTNRKIINYSSLRDNQNWLYSVLFDRAVHETQIANIPMPIQGSEQSFPVPIQIGPSGNATSAYNIALQLLQRLMKAHQGVRFGIGGRLNRVVSLESDSGNLVPNIFQLSSGETALLNLFLSILRDFDLTETVFNSADQIRGTVIVDEIDLHLHAIHQYEILPSLIGMLPKVQFIVTTHSPLFVLGMSRVLGEDGFALYKMPEGDHINPEQFSEFGGAYSAFISTSRYLDDVRSAVQYAQRPIVYLEGDTDLKYLPRASDLLGKSSLLEAIDLKNGNGDALNTAWKRISNSPAESVPRTVIVIRDCDYRDGPADRDHRFRRTIPLQENHPIQEGIENLFSKGTLEKAHAYKGAFIDIAETHQITERGQQKTIPEQWTVNKDEKTNLCNWLCENGTAEDFQHFQVAWPVGRTPSNRPSHLDRQAGFTGRRPRHLLGAL